MIGRNHPEGSKLVQERVNILEEMRKGASKESFDDNEYVEQLKILNEELGSIQLPTNQTIIDLDHQLSEIEAMPKPNVEDERRSLLAKFQSEVVNEENRHQEALLSINMSEIDSLFDYSIFETLRNESKKKTDALEPTIMKLTEDLDGLQSVIFEVATHDEDEEKLQEELRKASEEAKKRIKAAEMIKNDEIEMFVKKLDTLRHEISDALHSERLKSDMDMEKFHNQMEQLRQKRSKMQDVLSGWEEKLKADFT